MIKFIIIAGSFSLILSSQAMASTKIIEGDEFHVRMEEAISSKTAIPGRKFSVTLADDVKLADGTVLKAGYRGVGRVVEASRNGMLGRSGEVNITIDYIRVGDERIPLRGGTGVAGSQNTMGVIGAVIVTGGIGLFVKGRSVEIPKGQVLTVYADEDTTLNALVLPPPPSQPEAAPAAAGGK